MDDASCGAAREPAARDALDGFGGPERAYVGEELRPVGQQVQQEHRSAVERVVFRGEGDCFADAVPVERRVEDRFREVAVGSEVGPLALPLESPGNGVVSHGLLFEAHFGQFRIAVHQVTEDECHLYDIFPDGVFLFA